MQYYSVLFAVVLSLTTIFQAAIARCENDSAIDKIVRKE